MSIKPTQAILTFVLLSTPVLVSGDTTRATPCACPGICEHEECGISGCNSGEPKVEYPLSVRIVQPYDEDEVWVLPVIAPIFTFRVEDGKPLPDKGFIRFVQAGETKTAIKDGVTFSYPVVLLRCEDKRTLSLTGVDMAGMPPR